MQWEADILRFHAGERIQHPAPEAAVEEPPTGTPAAAGELLAVLVDLSPAFPHRSREIRALAVEAYWTSGGSSVARLRRALATVNRYLTRTNATSNPDQHVSGSITCAVFFQEELFVGQVGPGNALLLHPDGRVEFFPHEVRQMLPLGATLPPIMHISYANVTKECALLLTTSGVAEAQSAAAWQALLAQSAGEPGMPEVMRTLKEAAVTGSAIWLRWPRKVYTAAPTPQRPRFPLWRKLKPQPVDFDEVASLAPTPEPEVPPDSASPPLAAPVAEAEASFTLPTPDAARRVQPPAPVLPEPVSERLPSAEVEEADGLPDFMHAAPESDVSPQAEPRRSWWARLQLPRLRVPRVSRRALKPLASKERAADQRVPLKTVFEALLPGGVGVGASRRGRHVPAEQPAVMGGLALGFLITIAFITLTTHWQFGGALRAEVMLKEAGEANRVAYSTQAPEDWQDALSVAEQVLTLDSQNTEALLLRDEARLALDALEQSALLSVTPIVELGVAPAPRRLLVAQSWIYLLNPATDEVLGIPLSEDGITPASSAPTPILKGGQTISGETVERLADMAWMEPGPGYPDGAVFIYSDNGNLYIYEPSLGPGSITFQRLPGNPEPGMVTLVETFNGQVYLVNRQDNQLWKYVSVNGLYDSPARPYFASEVAPPLQNVLDLGVDGRLYLLLGDGSIHTYFTGNEDLSFNLQGLPDPDFRPTVMTVEPDPETGRIYLGDVQQERVVTLDKRGYFQHQYRMPGKALQQLEAMAINERGDIFYFVAENRLYAAPIPEFAMHSESVAD